MKILILNSGRKFTGEAAHCLDLVEQLVLQGHDASLVIRHGGVLLDRARQQGMPIAAVLKFAGGVQVHSTVNDFLTLRRLIKRERPDVVHCHRGNDHGLAVAAIAGMGASRRPAMLRTRHRVIPVHNTVANRWLFTRKTDGVISVSKMAAQSFGEMGPLIADKMALIYSSVDMKGFNPERRSIEWRSSHGIADDEPLVGLIARLQRVKGQEYFIRAAALVLKEFPKARFLVAGRGPVHKRERMADLASELGIRDRFIFEDWLPDVQMVTASLDIGVLASLGSEGSSRVTYEYMASGVPVVATSVGCIPEVLHNGHTGFIVPPADPHAMADAIVGALKSPEAMMNMRRQALARIEEFHNRERWVAETVAEYEKAIKRKNGQLG